MRRTPWFPGLRAGLAAGFALAVLAASGARAAPDARAKVPPAPRIVQEQDKTIVRKKTVIDFNDVTVEGELTKPEGSYLLNRGKTRFQSLIKLRDNFNPELQKSADNL